MLANHTLPARQRGLSLVELLVATGIGLFVMAGIVSLFVTNLGNSRRLNAEARVNQDMRTAAELVTRDLRRANYWANSVSGTLINPVTKATTRNDYVGVTSSAGQINYNFARDANDILNSNEKFGFRLNNSVIEMRTDGATWQAITNSDIVRISSFAITPVVTSLPAGAVCMKPCAAGSVSPEGTNCPTVIVRRYSIVLQGNGATDARVTRELRAGVRVRNDEFAGACPL